jgi:anti-anti-sigma factor
MEAINIRDSIKITPTVIKKSREYVALQLVGYLDTYNSKPFQDYVNDIINKGYHHIIMDCSGLTYVSSTGIGSFTAFNRALLPKKGNLVLVNLIPKVFEVFKLLGFLNFFKIFPTVEAAIEDLEKNAESSDKTQGGGQATQTKENTGQSANFPLSTSCPNCSKMLKFSKPGKFKCIFCKSILSVKQEGKVDLVQKAE